MQAPNLVTLYPTVVETFNTYVNFMVVLEGKSGYHHS